MSRHFGHKRIVYGAPDSILVWASGEAVSGDAVSGLVRLCRVGKSESVSGESVSGLLRLCRVGKCERLCRVAV